MGGSGHKLLFSHTDCRRSLIKHKHSGPLTYSYTLPGKWREFPGSGMVIWSLFLSSFPGPVNENNSDLGKRVSSVDALSSDGMFQPRLR